MTIAIFPNSAGWNEIGPIADAEVGAVDLLADHRHARQQQQQQAGGRDRVAVALEHAEVAQEDDRRREQDQPDDEPLRLLARERLVDPVDHDEPEAGEHRDEREQVRVGVRQRRADHEVPAQAEREEAGAVGQRDVGELGRLLDEDRGEAGGEEERGGDEREQLAVAGAHSTSALLERDHEVLGVVARAQLVVGEARAPRGRDARRASRRSRSSARRARCRTAARRAGRGRSSPCGRRPGRCR